MPGATGRSALPWYLGRLGRRIGLGGRGGRGLGGCRRGLDRCRRRRHCRWGRRERRGCGRGGLVRRGPLLRNLLVELRIRDRSSGWFGDGHVACRRRGAEPHRPPARAPLSTPVEAPPGDSDIRHNGLAETGAPALSTTPLSDLGLTVRNSALAKFMCINHDGAHVVTERRSARTPDRASTKGSARSGERAGALCANSPRQPRAPAPFPTPGGHRHALFTARRRPDHHRPGRRSAFTSSPPPGIGASPAGIRRRAASGGPPKGHCGPTVSCPAASPGPPFGPREACRIPTTRASPSANTGAPALRSSHPAVRVLKRAGRRFHGQHGQLVP